MLKQILWRAQVDKRIAEKVYSIGQHKIYTSYSSKDLLFQQLIMQFDLLLN